MATRALALDFPPDRGLSPTTRKALIDAGWMLLAALALRCWWFGDPVVQVDEQFYLLVGDRMLHGAVPYLDIWDRKPIGLFLVYAAIRLLGGGGIVEYQVVASLCAATNAFLIVRIARHIASGTAARFAGVAALVWAIVYDGAGGQAPIFYNPLVAGAALLTLSTIAPARARRLPVAAGGAAAMALIGLAIQIKYTALFEGMALGLLLLWQARREAPRAIVIPLGALWIAIALAPTVIAFVAYAVAGHGEAFVYANFLSIGHRVGPSPLTLVKRAAVIALMGLPLIVAALVGLRTRQRSEEARRAQFVIAIWLAAAVIGFFAIGTLYKHYALPMVTPLAIAAAPALDHGRRGRWRPAALIAVGLLVAFVLSVHRVRLRGGEDDVAALTNAIRPHLTGSLFVFEGEPILYYTTGAALGSPYAFPSHLNQKREAAAIGVDQLGELRRTFAKRPSVVVVSNRPAKGANPLAWEFVRHALARDYRLVDAIRMQRKLRLIYVLNARLSPHAA